MSNNLEAARNLKWIMFVFEQMSGMRINFHKCDLIPINVEEEQACLVAQALSCKLGKFTLKYLGVPLDHSKLRKENLQPLVDKILKQAGVGGVSSCLMLLSWNGLEACWQVSQSINGCD